MLVSGLGALLIAGGIITMYFGLLEPSYINKTVSSMSKYHDKLVLSHNISTTLQVAESLPDSHQMEEKILLVSELL